MIKHVIKRDGTKAEFNSARITNAILKAMNSVGQENRALAVKLTNEIIERAAKEPRVEELQDFVELVLQEKGLDELFMVFSFYRDKRAETRELKEMLGVKDEFKLSTNAINLLKKRYLKKDESSTSDLFHRVARAVAQAEKNFNNGDPVAMEEAFYQMMTNLEFLPNSPALMNAGTNLGQLSACFVLPVSDSLDSIFTTLKNTALIFQSGGGVGYNFSALRPEGVIVKSTGGTASGPVSFIKVFDVTTEVVKQGGKRRGANMAVLNHNHPEIFKFINAKQGGEYSNFNFSISVTDSFMRKVISESDYWLVNPCNNKKMTKVNASEVLAQVIHNAWLTGDPGLLFIDEINRKHPLKRDVVATNPCGEQPLLPYESCNLGAINLAKMVNDSGVDWVRLERVTRLAVRFLDDVIEVNKFPLKEVKEATLATRKIGLGVMGFADLLIKLGIPYDSGRALKMAGRIMKFIQDKARDESSNLGFKRGSFPLFNQSKLRHKYKHMRNATVTTIAPTGSRSIIADCSAGIEPLFAVSFTRHILDGSYQEVNQDFLSTALKQGFYSKELIRKVKKSGSVQELDVPDGVKKLFKTALEISPEWHVKMQAEFQKYTDNAVSKTVNLPSDASIDDVMKIFMLAYKLKCKGITVYRYGSKKNQVLTCESCD